MALVALGARSTSAAPASPPTSAPAAAEYVLPPGQDARIEEALGGEEPLVGCSFEGAAIKRTEVRARYRCDGHGVSVAVRHRAVPGKRCAEVDALAIYSPNIALCAALSARFATRPLTWTKVATPPADRPDPAGASATPAPSQHQTLSPEARAALADVDALMRAGEGRLLLDRLLPVAAKDPHPLLLGGIVVGAALVAGGPDAVAAVDQLLADADAHPDDALAQFVAGVAVHYRGHTQGATRAAKSADYARAIARLEPLRERFAASPRLWIYLAVSYVRTGRQADAEAAIARAIAADTGNDADVWYCRAEVLHRTQPAAALADIGRYIAIMAKNKAEGAWSAPEKDHKVKAMHAFMAEVAAGTRPLPEDPDLFDPVVVTVRGERVVPIELAFIVAFAALIVALAASVGRPSDEGRR